MIENVTIGVGSVWRRGAPKWFYGEFEFLPPVFVEEDCDKLSAAVDCDDEDAPRLFAGMLVL